MISTVLLRRGLLAITFVAFAVSLWAAFMNLRSADGAIRSRLAENAVWAAAQVQNELARYRDAVHILVTTGDRSDAERLQHRFDILWSRVGVLESGELALLLAEADITSMVADLRSELVRLDPMVSSVDARDVLRNANLQSESAALWPKVQTMAAAIMQMEQDRVARLIDEREEAIEWITLSLLGLMLSGIVTLAGLALSLRRARIAGHQTDLAREAAVDANGRLTAALEGMSDGFAVVDAEGRFSLLNGQFSSIFDSAPIEASHGGDLRHFFEALGTQETGLGSLAQPSAEEPTHVTLSLADGRHVDVRIRPMAGGGQVIVATDATARERWLEQTENARLAAEHSNTAKSRFLAMMSHEIRTPMNGVLGLLEVLSDSPLPPEAERNVEIALRSAGTLRTVIDDLLDASKIEAGELRLDARVFSPSRLLTEACDLLRANAVEMQTLLTDRMALDVPSNVSGDPERIKQVLTNLIGNAIKFTRGGTVDVSLDTRVNEDRIQVMRFTVRDSGIGIPEENQDDLFRPFHQIDSGYARKFGGTGLGLSISKALVEAMGGTISFSSAPGQGSTFTFDVPLIRAAAPIQSLDESSANTNAPSVSPRVLLIEDSETNRLVARTFLRSIDAVVDEAENGRIGVTLAGSRSYDLVLMDVAMPVMDGIEATRRIRQFSDVPIVGLSAHAFQEEISTCLDAGMDDYLAKPVSREALVSKALAISKRPVQETCYRRAEC